MAYVRKTRDVWEIRSNYGQGYEISCTETTRKQGLATLRLYRENQPEFAHTLKKVRERIKPCVKS